jgi:outer membrane translocation and assembly module TamA
LRGFDKNRFYGRNLMALSVEYRWEAMPFVELALFWDGGKAFGSEDHFDLDHLRKSYGFGLRFKSPNALAFRVDVARSDEGVHLYLKFSPSF